MDRNQAKGILSSTLRNSFDKNKYLYFLKNLLKSYDDKISLSLGDQIPPNFQSYVSRCERIGVYNDGEKDIDLLIVSLEKPSSLERAKTGQRNFIAWYLKQTGKEAALVAFVPPEENESWRFSLVRMDYQFLPKAGGGFTVREIFSPARRWSFLVGKNEKIHTVQSRFLPLIEDDYKKPTLKDLESAFSVEPVTDQFFEAYKFALEQKILKSLKKYDADTNDKYAFSQQLLSRILFIYFLQRKGWLKWKDYEIDKNYLGTLWQKYKNLSDKKDVFYSRWLCSLFFGAFNKKSHLISRDLPQEIAESFRLMPFLNGGLFARNKFDELGFDLPDSVFEWLFEPDDYDTDGRKGFLERFNFTIDEATPLDVEVAVDPEMLGRVYESLINEEERGEAGIFYTPRVEIDLMCKLSLVNYLNARTGINKEDLIDIVFNPQIIEAYPDTEKLKNIKYYLDRVKIVDPAVGSASFLVGMLNILVEIHSQLSRRMERKEENIFGLKQKIILENLYGVDVKEWAVMVGELRLWLSLIIETEEKFIEGYYNKPLLPNLNFKIRQGDSLVEDIGGIFINLRGKAINQIPAGIKQKIDRLIDEKAEFFSGKRSSSLKEIEEIEDLEKEIFKEILQDKLNKLNLRLSSHSRSLLSLADSKILFEELSEKSKREIKTLKDEIEQIQSEIIKYQEAINNIDQKGKKDYFLWELDFAEVFVNNGGFDIVIGNPPYVRQELIAPPTENEKKYSADRWRELKKDYKEKLIKATKSVWPAIKNIDKKSDLYVYFYYQGLSLLNDGGIFCFINSNSWLDVGYGAGLQEFLLKNMKPVYIIDNIAKRSFKQADVNTVIVLIQKPKDKLDDFTVKFVAFKKPFEEAISPQILKEIEQTTLPVFNHEVYRVYPKTKKELIEEGIEYPEEGELKLGLTPEQLPYIGNKWGGKYLRAPEIYFKILEKGKGKLVRLGDIAEVRFGIKTGANEFFYLKPVGKTVKEVVEIAEKNPGALIEVENGAGWRGEIEAKFLKPVITSYEETKNINIEPDMLVFLYPEINYKKNKYVANKYIEWGKKQKTKGRQKQSPGISLPRIESLKNRKYWYSFKISNDLLAKIFWQKRVGERFCVFFSKEKCFADQKFYALNKIDLDELDFALTTNSILQRLFLEIEAVSYTGSYTLIEISVKHLLRLPLIKLANINDKKNLLSRKKFLSIFEELGFDPSRPIREQKPNPLPDRKALDDIVSDALGLTEEERKEVYWAVAELVKARLEKAKSV